MVESWVNSAESLGADLHLELTGTGSRRAVLIRALREAPEIGSGLTTHIDVPLPAGVLAHRADGPTGTMVFLHNLGTEDVEVDLSTLQPEADQPIDVLSDRGYDEVGKLDRLKLAGHGYRWIRLCRSWSV